MPKHFAIVGAGPGGLYLAEALNRKLPDANIDVIDRLPAPYGLVRYGVAPDHQGTKAVTRVFERLLQKPGIRFVGNVEIGRDLALDDLLTDYDAVAVATGAPLDRRLGIPGEALPGVVGSAQFVGWYNGHPDLAELRPDLSRVRAVAIIGNGNVAIDVARVLAKTPTEMARADLAPPAAAAIAAAPLEAVHVIGRRGPVEANFTNAELAEIGRLENAWPIVALRDLPVFPGEVDPATLKVKEANLATLRAFAAMEAARRRVAIHFDFHCRPLEIVGRDRARAVRVATPTGEREIAADLVVTCIGYRAAPPPGCPFDEARGIVPNDGGRVAPRLYAAGWARRGPSGVIPTNRTDSMAVAELMLADLVDSEERPGPKGLDRRLRERGAWPVDFNAWKRIDAAEIAAVGGGSAPRVKLASWAAMLSVAGEH